MRTYDEIKAGVIKAFQRDLPGEKVEMSVFAIYLLDNYCRLMETHEFYRRIIKGRDL